MAKLLWALILCAGIIYTNADDLEACSLGHITDVTDWPSVAQVEFRVGLVWVQQCSATILTSYHVLSTANCFSGSLYLPENRRIRAGASVRADEGVVSGVRYAHINPSYGLLGNDGDIAVVQLETGLQLNGVTIAQASILGSGIELPFGLPVQLVAWGATSQGYVSDAELYELQLFVHSPDQCLNKYLVSEHREVITENMICAGLTYTQGRDLDLRDLGAPLFYQEVLSGIVSFGRQADDEYPVVATAVSPYSDWIVEVASTLV